MRVKSGDTGRFMSRNDMYHGNSRGWDDGWSERNMSRENRGGSQGGNGMSMHSVKDQAIQRLENLMDSAKSDYERQEIMNMIKTIENQPR